MRYWDGDSVTWFLGAGGMTSLFLLFSLWKGPISQLDTAWRRKLF